MQYVIGMVFFFCVCVCVCERNRDVNVVGVIVGPWLLAQGLISSVLIFCFESNHEGFSLTVNSDFLNQFLCENCE